MDKGFIKYVKENKKAFIILVLVLLGLLLVSLPVLNKKDTDDAPSVMTLEEYRDMLEGELSALCKKVSGVGDCRVFITFEKGAHNTYKGSVLIETKPPVVSGVTIVCRGADSDSVKKDLIDMATALFGIGANRVAILKLNS